MPIIDRSSIHPLPITIILVKEWVHSMTDPPILCDTMDNELYIVWYIFYIDIYFGMNDVVNRWISYVLYFPAVCLKKQNEKFLFSFILVRQIMLITMQHLVMTCAIQLYNADWKFLLALMLFPKKKIYNKFNILLQLLDLEAGTYWRYWTILSFNYYLRLIVNYQSFILQIEKCRGCIFP